MVGDYGDQKYKFMPGDDVSIRDCPQEGPYLIEKVEDGRYTLCDFQGERVKEGQKFEEQALEVHDPFV